MVKKIMAFVVAGAAVLAAVILPLDIARSRPELLGEAEDGADSRTSAALSPGPDSSDGEPALPSETSGLTEIISPDVSLGSARTEEHTSELQSQ